MERENWRRDQAVKEQLRTMTLGDILKSEWAVVPAEAVLSMSVAQFTSSHVRSRRSQAAMLKLSEQRVTSQEEPFTVAQILALPVTALLNNAGISNHVLGKNA